MNKPTRPQPGTYYRLYCDECMFDHWVEARRIRGRDEYFCHGEAFQPKPAPGQYTRKAPRLGGQVGIEIIEPSRVPLPLDWQIAIKTREDAEFMTNEE